MGALTGYLSYSYYLMHSLALKFGFLALSIAAPRLAVGWPGFLALLVVMFAWTLLPSAVLYLLVERPFSLSPARTPSGAQGIQAIAS